MPCRRCRRRRALFAADDGNSGAELWITDGTQQGTRLFLDLREGPEGRGASVPVVIGDRGWFFADDGSGSALWGTDGTPAGTVKVAQPGWMLAYDIVEVGDRLFFAAVDDSNGRELWTSDGTSGGTRLVADIWAGQLGSSPSALTPFGDRLVFEAQRGNGVEAWITDGTEAGTSSLDTASTEDSPQGSFVAAGEALVFTGSGNDRNAATLWRTDGTVDGTASLGVQSDGSAAPFQGRAWFLSDAALWATDATAAGTERVADLGAGSAWSWWRPRSCSSTPSTGSGAQTAPPRGRSGSCRATAPRRSCMASSRSATMRSRCWATRSPRRCTAQVVCRGTWWRSPPPRPKAPRSPPEPSEPSPSEPDESSEPVAPREDPFADAERTQAVGGDEPVATAVAVSELRFADAEPASSRSLQQVGDRSASHIVLSRDDAFPDSLAGAGLTGDGPLLLTAPAVLPATTADELARVLAPGGRVYLLGGVAAISQAVEDGLRADGYEVVRLFGASRVETSLAVADEVRRRGGVTDRVLVARAFGTAGNETAGWADSVTGGGWSAASGVPVVVTPSDGVHPALAAWLGEREVSASVLLGAQTALSQEVERALPSPVRVSGAERTATAVAIARELWRVPAAGERAFVVIDGFRDDGWKAGLTAAGLAADAGAPLLVVGDEVPGPVAELIASCGEPSVATVAVGAVAEAVRVDLDELDGRAC